MLVTLGANYDVQKAMVFGKPLWRMVLGLWFWAYGFGPMVLGVSFGPMILGAQPCKGGQAKLKSIYAY